MTFQQHSTDFTVPPPETPDYQIRVQAMDFACRIWAVSEPLALSDLANEIYDFLTGTPPEN